MPHRGNSRSSFLFRVRIFAHNPSQLFSHLTHFLSSCGGKFAAPAAAPSLSPSRLSPASSSSSSSSRYAVSPRSPRTVKSSTGPTASGGRCKRCHHKLGPGEKFAVRNGKTYCMKHAHPKCKGCKKDMIGQCIEFKGKKFHPQCFVCSKCRAQLGSSCYEKNGKRVCQRCNRL